MGYYDLSQRWGTDCMSFLVICPYMGSTRVWSGVSTSQEALHALLTVRGKTGAVLMVRPIYSENADRIVAAMATDLPVPLRPQVG